MTEAAGGGCVGGRVAAKALGPERLHRGLAGGWRPVFDGQHLGWG